MIRLVFLLSSMSDILKNKFSFQFPNNFLCNIIEADLLSSVYIKRYDSFGLEIPLIVTRFPPEPNGYLHIGHAKSIWLNFSLANHYKGRCHLRFDDTNPETENQKYVDNIIESIKWLGFNWNYNNHAYIFYASNYFDIMYAAAQALIRAGYAYVDEQSVEKIRQMRGTLIKPGINSPWRNRSVNESLRLFEEMRIGKYSDGSLVLRAKINMASSNINLRDPTMYRISHTAHYNTNNQWRIYPMYSYAHPIEDAIENVTHSICTLEFENQRPFYDWVLDRLTEIKFFKKPVPHQYEFSRLNLTYIVTSKRKLKKLVDENIVSGWDDPRMPTIIGLRRRGYTPEAIRLMCARTGVSKSNSWIDYSVLEDALRDDLSPKAPRIVGVLHPLKLIVDNFSECESITCSAPVYPPMHPMYDNEQRHFQFTKQLWIEQEDFMEIPSKGYFRLFPGNKVRLRYGYVVECTGFDKDDNGTVIAVHCNYYANSKSGSKDSVQYKVKGNLHWVSVNYSVNIKVNLYDHLFINPHPDTDSVDFKLTLNPNSLKVINAYLEPTIKKIVIGNVYQFERHGYFIIDHIDSSDGKIVFNRAVTLKHSWNR